MAQSDRLVTGGRIDRSRPVRFQFNGRPYVGFEGDTLASALIANGVRVTARSFKYHRPRGIVGHGPEEPATLVELDGADASANQPATTVPLREGLSARSVNCWPSPELDLGGVNQLFARFIPAGFYYKTFKWPGWHLYEPSIRRAAGLASAPAQAPQAGHFEARHAHADVLVVGAGPAGLQAALQAARDGKRVMLVDEGTEAGGSLLNRNLTIGGKDALAWVADCLAELSGFGHVTHLQNATAWAYREHNYVIVNERSPVSETVLERSWRVRAGEVVIATGATERTLVFGNNDRPGVMLASSVQTYVNRYAARPGRRALLFTNNNSAYAVAADLTTAGIEVAAIVDSRREVPEAALALVPNLRVIAGSVITRVSGHKRVKAVRIAPFGGGGETVIRCDVVAHSGGWNPVVHLWSQSRSSVRYDEPLAAFLPDEAAQVCRCVGAAAGDMTLDKIVKGGIELAYSVEPLWHVDSATTGPKAFVDIQNDVSLGDVQLAMREGYDNIEHVKRYTTGGMGIDQGKTGNINIIGAVSKVAGASPGDVGTTTFRSPYTPVSFGSISGLREETIVVPYRHTPVTKWNIDQGAVMYEAGARWRRPGYYPKAGEPLQHTVNREYAAARERVAVYDGSPLGKFELKGRDVPRLLDLLYTNVMSSLRTGHGRYGIMLSEDGLIFDDGVSFRLDEDRWLMSTSTVYAESVGQYMERLLQTEFTDWQVMVTNVTSQWANATICGPRARELLAALGTDIDLSVEAFPFMTFREGHVAGLPARVIRVSFTGELSFEINVAPRHFVELWQQVIAAGSQFGILPIGSETNHVLRVEKGFLSLGHEVDGTVDPHDLGMGWIMSKKKPDFIGKRSVELRRATGKPRRELVGLLPIDPNQQLPEGAPLTPDGRKEATEGLVTACVWSVRLQRWVALALLQDGRARFGTTVHIRTRRGSIAAEVTVPVFYDPDGALMRS